MRGSKSSLSTLNEYFWSSVRFRDESIVNVIGKNYIKIQTINGFAETISDVLSSCV